MTKTFYLHVGFHKTATSSFQETCMRSAGLLKSLGITYPLFSCNAANIKIIANHSIPFFSLFTEYPDQYHWNRRFCPDKTEEVNLSYYRQFQHYLETSDNILVSGEDISSLSHLALSKLIDKILNITLK